MDELEIHDGFFSIYVADCEKNYWLSVAIYPTIDGCKTSMGYNTQFIGFDSFKIELEQAKKMLMYQLATKNKDADEIKLERKNIKKRKPVNALFELIQKYIEHVGDE